MMPTLEQFTQEYILRRKVLGRARAGHVDVKGSGGQIDHHENWQLVSS